MSRNIIETLLGAVVLAVAVAFLVYAYTATDIGQRDGYELVAKFDRADGLEIGGEVRISGVRVGRVASKTLDPRTFRAEVRFTVGHHIEVPADSSAAIVSASLLGGKYLSLTPGGDDEVLRPGGEIMFTQSAVILEDLIGQFIFDGAAP